MIQANRALVITTLIAAVVFMAASTMMTKMVYVANLSHTSEYYALGHPSDPNYFRIMGGSDFGIDYQPPHHEDFEQMPHSSHP